MRSMTLATVSGLLLALGCRSAAAQFVPPTDYGWERGDAGTTWADWDGFDSASAPNAPTAGQFPDPTPAGWNAPTLACLTASAFVTSTGNIYSMDDATEIEVAFPSYNDAGTTTTVLLQTRTVGTEIDPATMLCDDAAPVEVVELSRVPVGFGDQVETAWRFEVPTASDHLISFAATGPHMSFSAASIDTQESTDDCLADVNQNGAVEPTDFSAWIAAYNTNDPRADQNQNGVVEPTDFAAWIANFNAGC